MILEKLQTFRKRSCDKTRRQKARSIQPQAIALEGTALMDRGQQTSAPTEHETDLTSSPTTRGRQQGAGDEAQVVIDGTAFIADLSGAVYWADEGLLAVADLHFEKGSAFALHGMLLPPYDTASTLERLAWVIAYYDPRLVVALGDNFHDGDGATRLQPEDRAALYSLQRGRDWIWITGNHDPQPVVGVGGEFARSVACENIHFRHEPGADRSSSEVAGHLHPSARIRQRGRTLTRRCFAASDRRLILPAFGAYAGGLNIRHSAFTGVFGGLAFTAHLIGDRSIFSLPAACCRVE
jgi:DNA ligase-associated metallophosphoesterase